MSEFRDRVSNDVINAAGHPERASDTLTALLKGMNAKLSVHQVEKVDAKYLSGMIEMAAFVANITNDIRREYGIEKEKGN